ncbi:MAG: tetratricopeptide repeat protein [Burkholderiales bacterium]|jgi:Tfp pilus assembly protein PilF|nr:tetratricopeptide repeat protein [Burkholderiales bacterium]MCE1175676.1 tetratricopeptide repeat protein [Burkholderiales bacterium]
MKATVSTLLTPRRIVTAIALCLASGVSSNFAHAQAQSAVEPLQSNGDNSTTYVLPKQTLTSEITTFQILSDLALSRGNLKVAYDGYTHLAKKTKDPRYAERAYWVAALANDLNAALLAADLLKSIAPNATLGQDLVEQAYIKKILDKSEAGQLREAYQATKTFLNTHPNHELGLTLLADIASKLKLDDETLYAFEQLYRLSPNDPEAMNNLGYFLADHNLRLDEANQLITRALQKSPKAPHIIDSAAWVAYRQNDLDKALKLAQQAHQLSNAPDIALHLAEILWVKGDVNAARQIFTTLKSLPASQPNEEIQALLNETLKRLGVNLTESTAP